MPLRHISHTGFRRAHRLAPEKILALSFAGFILLGALLLMTPAATTDKPISFVDALFTTTSATCVTGLAVVDTGTYFTRFGQIVILISIQLGGIGIMTFSTFVLYIFGRRLSVRDADVLSKSLGQTHGTTPRGLLWTVIGISLLIEMAGALFLYGRFSGDMPVGEAIWSSVFHSVSAFCNAGFSLFKDNLIGYAGDPTVNITIMLLIVLGGIGFVVFLELFRFISSRVKSAIEAFKGKRQASYLAEAPFRFSMHSKIVLVMTLVLILGGALLVGVLEYENIQKDMPWGTRILTSLFQSVTPRTAGFNTVDVGLMTDACLGVLVVLMFIGASPGSCGGGIKTSTFAVLTSMIRASLRKEDHVTFFKRSVGRLVQSEAVTVTALAAAVVVGGTMLLLVLEVAGLSHGAARGKFLELLFETTSAFGTVGLSTGVTPNLLPSSKVVLVLIMFIGRLGPLTLAIAITRKRAATNVKYPEGRVLIG